MQRVSKQILAMVLGMICLLMCVTVKVSAVEDEPAVDTIEEAVGEIPQETTEEIIEDPEGVNEDEVIKSVESPVESNFTSKAYYVEGEDKNNYLVEGGNEDAVNLMATEQSTASGTLTESSNIEGEAYDMTLPTEEDFEEKDPLELRQFITFETKSGKEFHIIIDHGQDGDNVRMLTEVSEQDLLNLIEAQADVEIGLIEDEAEVPHEELLEETEPEPAQEELKVSDTTEEPVDYSLIIIVAAAGVTGIAGWYFKIYRPKRSAAFEDDVDEADYIDDDELINEDYE